MPETQAESEAKYANGYYAKKLEQGLEFQDVVTQALYQRGIVVVGYASRKWQNQKGENMLGAEIKRDDNFRKTGNLYIECAEKANPTNPAYVTSGVFRKDNSWLFVIGDEQTIYIFPTIYLRKLCMGRGYRQVQTPTSKGYLMPLAEAEKYCIRKIELEGEA
jgi:hypothetical protein